MCRKYTEGSLFDSGIIDTGWLAILQPIVRWDEWESAIGLEIYVHNGNAGITDFLLKKNTSYLGKKWLR